MSLQHKLNELDTLREAIRRLRYNVLHRNKDELNTRAVLEKEVTKSVIVSLGELHRNLANELPALDFVPMVDALLDKAMNDEPSAAMDTPVVVTGA